MAITANKLLGKGDKGGELVVIPKATLVKYNVESSGELTTKPEKPQEDVVYTISTKIIEIDKLLKGTLAAEKVQKEKERKQKEDDLRAKQEEDIEKPDGGEEDEETPRPLLPKMSFLDKIKDFLGKVIIGWLTFRLLKFLPKVIGIVKVIGKVADFVIWIGGKLLDGLITMVHWGYKAFEWTRGAIGNVFGEKGLEVFDGITGVLNKVLNLTITLTLAMIAFSDEFGSNIIEWGRGFISIFRRGLGRLGPRLLIKMFGKKTAGTILTKLGLKSAVTATTTTATTATVGATTATATTGAAKVGGVAVGVKVAVVGSALALSSALGEGMFQLKKQAQKKEEDSYAKFNDKGWLNPMKYFWGAVHLMDKFSSYLLGTVGVILDIVGTPFRYLIELIRYPFLSEEGKKKQNKNMAKFDARIREQFRELINAFSLGMLAKEKGSFGSLFGKKGTDAMGYTKDGKTESQQKTDVPSPTQSSLSEDLGKLVKGNVENIVPLDVNSVKNKTSNVSTQAFYEDPEGETIFVKVEDKSSFPFTEKGKESSTPLIMSGGGGSDEVGDLLYKGG